MTQPPPIGVPGVRLSPTGRRLPPGVGGNCSPLIGTPETDPPAARDLYVDGGTAVAPANQIGSMCAPFSTISAALASIPPPASSSDQASFFVLHIAPGIYDEDLTIPSGRNVKLWPEGQVTLGRPGLTVRNITWTNLGADGFGNAAILLLEGFFFITGKIDLNDGGAAPASTQLVLRSGVFLFGGGAGAQIDGTGHVFAGSDLSLILTFEINVIAGPGTDCINAPSARLEAVDANFSDGDIIVAQLNAFEGVDYTGTVNTTVTLVPINVGGIRQSPLSGVFTGPPLSFKADNYSIRQFELLGGSLAGGATIDPLDTTEAIQHITAQLDEDFIDPAAAFTTVLTQPITTLGTTRIRAHYSASASSDGISGDQLSFRLTLDGAAVAMAGSGSGARPIAASVPEAAGVVELLSPALAAGVHTVRLQVLNVTAGGSVQIRPLTSPSNEHATLVVEEVV